MFDELAQQYFNSPEEFAAAVKILQQYNYAVKKYPRFADFQENFLDQMDDVTGRDSRLLDRVMDYEKAKNFISGSPQQAPLTDQSQILEAIN